jgi:uncharacterized protein
VALRQKAICHSLMGAEEFCMKRLVLVACFGLCGFSGTAWSQAFNCDFAKAPDELTICRDASLGALDEQMSGQFYKIRQQLPPAGLRELKSGQADFMKRRTFCGTDGDCIAGMYAERIETLCALATDYGVACPKASE